MIRTSFKRSPLQKAKDNAYVRRQREPGEFDSFVAKPRMVPVCRIALVSDILDSIELEEPQRVTTTTTTAERDYMGRVAALDCVICRLLGQRQSTRTEVHHARAGAGMAQRGGNFLTIPLCSDCHRGSDVIHGSRNLLRMLRMGELDLLDITIGELTR
jgi:hypothetical protein